MMEKSTRQFSLRMDETDFANLSHESKKTGLSMNQILLNAYRQKRGVETISKAIDGVSESVSGTAADTRDSISDSEKKIITAVESEARALAFLLNKQVGNLLAETKKTASGSRAADAQKQGQDMPEIVVQLVAEFLLYWAPMGEKKEAAKAIQKRLWDNPRDLQNLSDLVSSFVEIFRGHPAESLTVGKIAAYAKNVRAGQVNIFKF